MKGKHRIKVHNRRIQFTLELERNITIIKGDSATGKTTLIGMLSDYEAQGSQSGVVVESDRQCKVLTSADWEERLRRINHCIVFVDEGNTFVNSKAFAEAVKKSDNYYVLITRESLYQLPYSVEAVLELKETARQGKFTYNQTYPYYKSIPKIDDQLRNVDYIMTEDSNAGNAMYNCIAEKRGKQCTSAQGKSNIYKKLLGFRDAHTLVVADGAAFGADMEKVYQLQKRYPLNITLYLPESFEWQILKSGMIHNAKVELILANPAEYIESSEFGSWEQFFTALLIEITSDQEYMRYNKQKLTPFYLQEENVQKFIDVAREE